VLKIFLFFVGSCEREDIGIMGMDSVPIAILTVYPIIIFTLSHTSNVRVMMGYWEADYLKRVHSLWSLERNNRLLLFSFAQVSTSVSYKKLSNGPKLCTRQSPTVSDSPLRQFVSHCRACRPDLTRTGTGRILSSRLVPCSW